MRIFGRDRTNTAESPVSAFWEWWRDTGRTISPHETTPLSDELTRRVRAIDPALTWHFGAGAVAQHRLTVSAAGIAESRPAAERWLRAAPPVTDGDTFEFRASHEADPGAIDAVIRLGDGNDDGFALADLRFGMTGDENRRRVNLDVFHPGFARATSEVRSTVTFLALDWLLGEDDVERWVGGVNPTADLSADGVTPDELRTAVATLAADRDPEQWVMGQFAGDGKPGFAMWRSGLRWLDAPTFDRHNAIAVRYRAGATGLPADNDVLEQLRGLENDLVAVLGTGGLLVAVETTDGTRTLHAYTDGDDQHVSDRLGRWAHERKLRLGAETDPAWRAMSDFFG